MRRSFRTLMLVFLTLCVALLPNGLAEAEVGSPILVVSVQQTTFISLQCREASPVEWIAVAMTENVDALDIIFRGLRAEERLLPSHPRLVISIAEYTGKVLPTRLSPEVSATLSLRDNYSGNAASHEGNATGAIDLGPVYLIELAAEFVDVNELFALVLSLPELSAAKPRLTLQSAEIRQRRNEFESVIAQKAETEWHVNDLLWSPDGTRLILAVWNNRLLNYQVINVAAQTRTILTERSLPFLYKMPPTFSRDSRFVVYAVRGELVILDVESQRVVSLPYREMLADERRDDPRVHFAVNDRGDALLFSLYGYGMDSPLNLVWRSREPMRLDKLSGLGFMEKPEGTGEEWGDFVTRRHPSLITTPSEFTALARDVATDKQVTLTPITQRLRDRYGNFHLLAVNHPRDTHLALVVGNGAHLKPRLLSLPTLAEVDWQAFAQVPETYTRLPFTIAGISPFNIAVITLLLLIAQIITRLLYATERSLAPYLGVFVNRRSRRSVFFGVLLVTLAVHAIASFGLVMVVDDAMGEVAALIARAHIAHQNFPFEDRVKFLNGHHARMGRSPLAWIDFPYQYLIWRLTDRDVFAAPMEIRQSYRVFDHQGNFVRRGDDRYFVFGIGRLVASHRP